MTHGTCWTDGIVGESGGSGGAGRAPANVPPNIQWYMKGKMSVSCSLNFLLGMACIYFSWERDTGSRRCVGKVQLPTSPLTRLL